jgi:hypothetical protein
VLLDRHSGTERATILVCVKHDCDYIATTFTQGSRNLPHHLDIEDV